MNNYNFEKTYNGLIKECKHSTHGYWKADDFKVWDKKPVDLTDEVCGVTSSY